MYKRALGPGEVIDLLYVETAVSAAAESHGDEDAVVHRRPRPSATLQVQAVLQCSLKPSVLSQTQFARGRFRSPPLPSTLHLTTNRHVYRGSVIFIGQLGQGGKGQVREYINIANKACNAVLLIPDTRWRGRCRVLTHSGRSHQAGSLDAHFSPEVWWFLVSLTALLVLGVLGLLGNY